MRSGPFLFKQICAIKLFQLCIKKAAVFKALFHEEIIHYHRKLSILLLPLISLTLSKAISYHMRNISPLPSLYLNFFTI